jgi:hypothetical protein
MEIRPTRAGQTPGAATPGTGRPQDAAAAPEGPETGSASAGAPDDRLSLSQALHELQESLGLEPVPAGEIPRARLEEVLRRVREGHYERSEVRDALVRRLADELGIQHRSE